MHFGIFPCIIKHHGSLKYFKFLLSSVRYESIKSKNTATQILAASSSPAPSIKQNPEDIFDKNRKTKKSHECVINGNVSLKPEPKFETISIKHQKEAKDDKTVKLLNVVSPSELEWEKQKFDTKLLLSHYKSLAKYRLTGLVVLTTLAGYGMAPAPFEPVTLLYTILGTGLLSAAANAVNQFLEVPYDSQMARTKNRVLVRNLVTPLHAFGFAMCCVTTGVTILCCGANLLTAALGISNFVLYTAVYTPLKRCTILNTWVGSIVGAIPPLIGWSACTGTLSSSALLMGAILYSWQFPHFMALSWNLRPDYSKAGYRMTSVVNPDLCRRTALRHSFIIAGLCCAAPLLDLTTWTFAFDSLPLNAYLIYCAWKFYQNADSQSSRRLFRLSLIHLPAIMVLMLIGKKYVSEEKKER